MSKNALLFVLGRRIPYVYVCVSVVGRWSRDRGRARKESNSWHAWDARPSIAVQLLLPLSMGNCSEVLDLTSQSPVIQGTVMWKLACAQGLSLIHISEPTRPKYASRMPSSA